MRAYTFTEVMAMSGTERAALYEGPSQHFDKRMRDEPIALTAEEIQKLADYAHTDFGTAACVVMKHGPSQYALYRQKSFRPVNS